jgi:hypothetical protein
MASVATSKADFVSLIAEEIVTGIEHATEYWLARIEQELTDRGSLRSKKFAPASAF